MSIVVVVVDVELIADYLMQVVGRFSSTKLLRLFEYISNNIST
jgi:hypothetical protein